MNTAHQNDIPKRALVDILEFDGRNHVPDANKFVDRRLRLERVRVYLDIEVEYTPGTSRGNAEKLSFGLSCFMVVEDGLNSRGNN